MKVCAWYDNEWGFTNRMLDTTVAFMNGRRLRPANARRLNRVPAAGTAAWPFSA